MDPDAPTMDAMALAARHRAAAWRLFGKVVAGPDADLVERVRDGRFAAEVSSLHGWLGDSPFEPALLALGPFPARNERIPLADDVAALRSQGVGSSAVAEVFEQCARECDAEAAAWAARDHAAAKADRVAQFHALADRLDPMVDWCRRLDDAGGLARALARVVAVHLSVESGRDISALVGPGHGGARG